MPIFEYLCPKCNIVFSFMVRNPKTAKDAYCPRCGNTDMKKRFSSFSVAGATRKSTGSEAATAAADDMPDLSARQERELMRLMNQAEGMDENDPRQMGRLMRKMSEVTGEALEPEMEEAVRRLEAGEDPETIEEDLGGLDADAGAGGTGAAPGYDDGMYSL